MTDDPSRYDPLPFARSPDGTIWVEFRHLETVPQWKRLAAHTRAGDVLLPARAFELDEAAIDDEAVREKTIVLRRRNARVYVGTTYLAELFPEDEPRLDFVRETVRRVVSSWLTRGYDPVPCPAPVEAGG